MRGDIADERYGNFSYGCCRYPDRLQHILKMAKSTQAGRARAALRNRTADGPIHSTHTNSQEVGYG
jgi:hypothetical protein